MSSATQKSRRIRYFKKRNGARLDGSSQAVRDTRLIVIKSGEEDMEGAALEYSFKKFDF